MPVRNTFDIVRKLGLVLLIPFVLGFNMDQMTGAVFLCAMHAVVHTGGSIPSILR